MTPFAAIDFETGKIVGAVRRAAVAIAAGRRFW